MKNGTHTVYRIQHKKTHINEWLILDSPLIEEPASEWTMSSDTFKGYIPWKNNKLEFPESSNDLHQVRLDTDLVGFYFLENAKNTIERLRRANIKGLHDTFDSYGKRHQRVRHQFRLIKEIITHKTERYIL